MQIRRITEKDFTSSKWSGGQTDELLILPAGASYKDRNFNMRLSSASVELEKSNFTSLPGVTRFICPLDNNLKLFHYTNSTKGSKDSASNAEILAELKPFEVFKFSGDMPIVSEGRCRDFNLMLKGSCDGFMESWNTEQEAGKEFSVRKNSLFWIFSYNASGRLLIEDENSSTENIGLDKMQLITLEGLYGKIKLKAGLNSGESKNLLYGLCYFC